jgi:hypothetical protein
MFEERNAAFGRRTTDAWRAPALAACVYVALAVAYTWPLVLHIGRCVPADGLDPLLNTFLLWWNTQGLPFTSGWWNPPFFFPVEGTLALSETLLGLSPLASPLLWLGASPLFAYDALFLLSFPLSGFAMRQLVWELSRRSDLALLGGLAFAFAPYRAAHLAHLQILCTFFLPLVFLGLHRFLETDRRRWLLLSAGAWALQSLTNGYFFLFTTVLLAAWLGWFVLPRRRWRALRAILLVWGVAAVVPLALCLQYGRRHALLGFARLSGEIESLSADALGFVTPPTALAHWSLASGLHAESWLFPGVTLPALVVLAFASWWRRARAGAPGALTTVAVAVAAVAATVAAVAAVTGPWHLRAGPLTLSVAALHKPLAVAFDALLIAAVSSRPLLEAWRRSAPAVFYGLAAVAASILALGPAPRFAGRVVWEKGPYALFLLLPGFGSLRAPARFTALAVFSLVCAAMLGLGALTSGLRRVRPWFALVAAGVLWDGWIRPLPLADAPVVFALPEAAGVVAAVIELPLGAERDTHAMYRATRHGLPVVNGYSGFDLAHHIALRQGLERGEPGVLRALQRHGSLLALLDPRAPEAGLLRDAVRAEDGVRLSMSPGGREAYVLPGLPASRAPLLGTRIAAQSVEWRRTRILCDLGAVEDVGGLRLVLGRGVSRLPPRVEVELAERLPSWQAAWEGRLGGLALEAALSDPRRVAVTLVTPGARGRHVRVRLFDRMMVEEIQVFRPVAGELRRAE